jgi:hypothetical protein
MLNPFALKGAQRRLPFRVPGRFFCAGAGVFIDKPVKACDLQAEGNNMKKPILLAAFAVLAHASIADTIITFDGLATSGNNTAYVAPPVDGSHDWSDSGVVFSHEVSWGGAAWDGMTYSSVNDTTTAGYLNQYAVYGDGMGMGDAGSYAVFYQPYTDRTMITLPTPAAVQGFYANNTTYAALAMLNGEGPARAFTTASNDWFKLTIEGFDVSDNSLGTVEFTLADYTGETGTVVSDWTFVDLSSLAGGVSTLGFTLSSSDNGAWGMNTPGYFAIDNLTVAAIPEPATFMLTVLSAAGAYGLRRFRV